MFKTAEKTELSQISLTGMRAIVLLGLLIVKPRSLEEIRKAFIDLNIMEDSHSDDILRIDLNTLKIMGCEISRSAPKTDFKYVLTKHPFELKPGKDEISLLKRLYNKIKSEANLQLLIDYHLLFEKISTFIFETEKKEAILGISILKYFKIEFLKDLMLDCKQKRVLTLVYKKPTEKEEYMKEIIAQELTVKNDKLYLYAYDPEKEESIVLNVRRIKTILTRKLQKREIEARKTKILFLLKEFAIDNLDTGEVLVAKEDNGYLIEGSYYNEFMAAQRILSLGADCTVVEPAEFKTVIIEKLKEMRKNYEQ